MIEVDTTDPNGVTELRLIQLIVKRELSGVNAYACYMSYDAGDNRLWLIADVGQGSAGSGHPGENATLAN